MTSGPILSQTQRVGARRPRTVLFRSFRALRARQAAPPGRFQGRLAGSLKLNMLLAASIGFLAPGCQGLGGTTKKVERVSPARADVPHTEGTGPDASENEKGDPLHPRVTISTTLGDIVVELDAEHAPATVLNFMQYVFDGYYKGTVFHRVLSDSMIQGGAYTPEMEEKVRGLVPPVPGSWRSDLANHRGTIAMIRGQGPGGGGTAQFYINVVDNKRLDDPSLTGRYAVFGRVVDGMDTVERIRHAPVGTHPNYAEGRSAVVPVAPITIKSVRLSSEFDPIQVQAAAAQAVESRQHRLETLLEELEAEAGRDIEEMSQGVRYVDLRVGDGPPVLITDKIMFNYTGKLVNGKVFETTMYSEPKTVAVGKLIQGLRDGIIGDQGRGAMNEGGHRVVVVPPELGYGATGVPRLIPPDATLIYDVEILAINPQP